MKTHDQTNEIEEILCRAIAPGMSSPATIPDRGRTQISFSWLEEIARERPLKTEHYGPLENLIDRTAESTLEMMRERKAGRATVARFGRAKNRAIRIVAYRRKVSPDVG